MMTSDMRARVREAEWDSPVNGYHDYEAWSALLRELERLSPGYAP